MNQKFSWIFIWNLLNSATSYSYNNGEPFVSKWRYKIPCVGVPNWKDKSTRCVLSTRFYRLHLVRIDSMCFINSIYRLLLVRIDSISGRWGKRRVSRAAWYGCYSSNKGARLRQGTEATGTPTAAQSSSDGDLLSLRSHSSYLLCFMNSRVK